LTNHLNNIHGRVILCLQLAFRVVQSSLTEIKERVANVLQLNDKKVSFNSSVNNGPNTGLLMESSGTQHGKNEDDNKNQERQKTHLLQALAAYIRHCSPKADQQRCVEVYAYFLHCVVTLVTD